MRAGSPHWPLQQGQGGSPFPHFPGQGQSPFATGTGRPWEISGLPSPGGGGGGFPSPGGVRKISQQQTSPPLPAPLQPHQFNPITNPHPPTLEPHNPQGHNLNQQSYGYPNMNPNGGHGQGQLLRNIGTSPPRQSVTPMPNPNGPLYPQNIPVQIITSNSNNTTTSSNNGNGNGNANANVLQPLSIDTNSNQKPPELVLIQPSPLQHLPQPLLTPVNDNPPLHPSTPTNDNANINPVICEEEFEDDEMYLPLVLEHGSSKDPTVSDPCPSSFSGMDEFPTVIPLITELGIKDDKT